MPSGTALGTRRFKALGTSAHLLVTDPGGTDRASALLTEELDAIDRACSRFRPDAELWRVNHARGRTMRVSSLLTEAVAVALAAADVTDGDVDPTCGRSLARLGYDRDFAQARRDTSPLSQPAVPAGGGRRWSLTVNGRRSRSPRTSHSTWGRLPRLWQPTVRRYGSRPR
jgi:thiamine biosynthesis lipoprotein